MSSSVSNDEAVITLKVKLVSETDEGDFLKPDPEFNKLIDELLAEQDFIDQEIKATVDEHIADSLEEAGVDLEAVQQMTEAIDEMGIAGLKNITNFAKSPEAFGENMIMNVLGKAGPYGALVAAIITAIAASPLLFKVIVEQMGVKGGPLNQDWRMTQEEQENLTFNRLTQFKRITGDSPFIRFDDQGFIMPSDPDFAGNSLVSASISRSGRVGLQDSSFGYIHGV